NQNTDRFPLTAKQRAFLDECAMSERCLNELMEDHNVSPRQFGLWLTRRAFRWHLERLGRVLRARREMDVRMGAAKGAEMLARHANGTFSIEKKPQERDHRPDLRQRAQVALIELAR